MEIKDEKVSQTEKPASRRGKRSLVRVILTRPKLFITIVTTIIFGYMVINEQVTAEQFLMIFSPIIALFFGDKSSEDNHDDREN